jgi:signal transduction histidine kinase
MRLSEAAVVSIELDGRLFASPGYSGDLDPNLHADISTRGERRGRLSVHYVTGESFLIPEEQDFVSGVADLIGQWLERRDAEERLREYSKRLENMVEERTEELKAAQQELLRKEKLAVLGQLAGGVGHELRNPLAVISNAIYYLRMKLAESDQDVKEYLGIIDSEVRNSEKIVSDLLDFSRAEPSEPERVQISKLVADVLQRLTIPDNTAVEAEIPEDLPPAIADPLQMTQVLANLITNAHQAMPRGGKLKIAAEARDGKAYISVSDDGCGISEENVGRLFEPLFTTKPRGVGLGLPICRILVQANGGSIQVRSEEGKGSTFTLILPAEDERRPGIETEGSDRDE